MPTERDLDDVTDRLDTLTAVIAHDANLPVGQANGGTMRVEENVEKWVRATSAPSGAATVKLTSDTESYDNVRVEDNGWLTCWNDGDDAGGRVEYPPHVIERVEREG